MPRKQLSESARQDRREALLDAAMRLFEADGEIASVSFRNLAREADCSYATPYSYFKNKDALLVAMRARAFRWMQHAMLDAMPTAASPTARLDALSQAYVQAGIDQPHRYALMFFGIDQTEAARQSLELQAAKHDALDVCTQVIQAAQDDGALPNTVDALTAAHLFWAAAHGLVALEVAGQFVMGRRLDQIAQLLIQTLRNGLEHPQAAALYAQAANA